MSVSRVMAIDSQRGYITRTKDGTKVRYFVDGHPDRESMVATQEAGTNGLAGPIRSTRWKDGSNTYVVEQKYDGNPVFIFFRYSNSDERQRQYALALARSTIACEHPRERGSNE